MWTGYTRCSIWRIILCFTPYLMSMCKKSKSGLYILLGISSSGKCCHKICYSVDIFGQGFVAWVQFRISKCLSFVEPRPRIVLVKDTVFQGNSTLWEKLVDTMNKLLLFFVGSVNSFLLPWYPAMIWFFQDVLVSQWLYQPRYHAADIWQSTKPCSTKNFVDWRWFSAEGFQSSAAPKQESGLHWTVQWEATCQAREWKSSNSWCMVSSGMKESDVFADIENRTRLRKLDRFGLFIVCGQELYCL